MKWNIENMVMIVIKHLQSDQISALNSPQGVQMPVKQINWNLNIGQLFFLG